MNHVATQEVAQVTKGRPGGCYQIGRPIAREQILTGIGNPLRV